MASAQRQFYRHFYGPVGLVRRAALRNGVVRGNTAWLAVWIAIATAGGVKRHVTRQERLVTADRLLPGQGLTIRTIAVASAKERKALLRGQK
jgi:hypothetical protein